MKFKVDDRVSIHGFPTDQELYNATGTILGIGARYAPGNCSYIILLDTPIKAGDKAVVLMDSCIKPIVRDLKIFIINTIYAITGNPCSIKSKDNLFDGLMMDRLDIVDLAMRLELKFDIIIPDDELETWETIEDVIKSAEKLNAD